RNKFSCSDPTGTSSPERVFPRGLNDAAVGSVVHLHADNAFCPIRLCGNDFMTSCRLRCFRITCHYLLARSNVLNRLRCAVGHEHESARHEAKTSWAPFSS